MFKKNSFGALFLFNRRCVLFVGSKNAIRFLTREGPFLALIFLVCWGSTFSAFADDIRDSRPLSVELPEPRLLREGERAPFTGQLLVQEDVLRWARTIEDLEYRLELDRTTEQERCSIRLQLEEARTKNAEDRLNLRETLWRQRAEELSNSLRNAQKNAIREWWESPPLWFAGGALTAVVSVLALFALR